MANTAIVVAAEAAAMGFGKRSVHQSTWFGKGSGGTGFGNRFNHEVKLCGSIAAAEAAAMGVRSSRVSSMVPAMFPSWQQGAVLREAGTTTQLDATVLSHLEGCGKDRRGQRGKPAATVGANSGCHNHCIRQASELQQSTTGGVMAAVNNGIMRGANKKAIQRGAKLLAMRLQRREATAGKGKRRQ